MKAYHKNKSCPLEHVTISFSPLVVFLTCVIPAFYKLQKYSCIVLFYVFAK